MAFKPSDRPILIFIVFVLLAILGLLTYQATKKTPAEKMADSISETVEDIGNAVSKETGN